jgi:two-component system, sensor histidine kinase PdtaS
LISASLNSFEAKLGFVIKLTSMTQISLFEGKCNTLFYFPVKCSVKFLLPLILSCQFFAFTLAESRTGNIDSTMKEDIPALRVKAKKLIFSAGDSCILVYKQALDLAMKRDDKEEMAMVLRDIGQYHIIKGRFDDAIDTLAKAWDIANDRRLLKLSGEIKSNMGVAYDYKGEYDSAIGAYSEALQTFITVGDTLSMATVYMNAGIVYEEMNKADEAIEYYNKALEISYIKNDKENIAILLNNLGVVYMEQKHELDKALDYFKQSMDRFIDMGQERGISSIYNNIGEIYEGKRKFEMAVQSYEKALALYEANGEKQGVVSSLRNLGDVHMKMQQYTKALSFLSRGITMAEEIGFKKARLDIYEVMTELYTRQGNYQDALRYNNLYYGLKDSIMNENLQEKMLEFQTRYETEKKNNEIARLQLEKLEQSARLKNQRLITYSLLIVFLVISGITVILFYYYNLKKKANAEKEVLIKEIHHRVKNNLQTISSLLSLQNNYIANNEIKDIVNESQGRVKAMALIHQLLYQQEPGSKIDFNQYLQQLCEAISDGYSVSTGEIDCSVNCKGIFLDIDTAIPIGLIANELFMNAFKHAFTKNIDRGRIEVLLSRQNEDNYIFTFKDNGIGLPDDINIENSQTLGLRLVYILVRQIKGVMHFKVDHGTEFTIVFNDFVKKRLH